MSKNLSEIPVQFVKGVGPAKAKLLANLGVVSVEDLFYLFPHRYEDRSHLTPIAMVKVGEYQTIAGQVVKVGKPNYYSKTKVFEIVVGDKTGHVFCKWFNQPYLEKYFKEGQEIVLYGRLEVFKNRLQMLVPDFELISTEERSLNMGRIVPVYPLTRGLTQRYLRGLMDSCLNLYATGLQDIIPPGIRKRHGLGHLSTSIRSIHFPVNQQEQQQAIGRVAFEEFFLFQICVILRRKSIVEKKGFAHRIEPSFIDQYVKSFPFILTEGQRKAMADIAIDMRKPRPMLRLLQGDVGCGKTVVAFFGCLAAVANGTQAAIMAPTELLATQHYENFKRMFAMMPVETSLMASLHGICVGLLTSRMPKKEKERLREQLKDKTIDVVIGTHALLQETVDFSHLSFVVIDEQHKFGVNQRALLSAKGSNPDVLIMTATPIPRTLCLTLYGDLDISTIRQMPPGRGKIATYLFPTQKAAAVYEQLRQWVSKGTQGYIVYPLVQESEKLDLKAAKESFEHFGQYEFKGFRLSLVHGQMDKGQLEDTMEKFRNYDIDILVATTVLEVGLDVPNANVMVIEHAERFGLSQLHQLRGRIGRGSKDAVCILVSDAATEEAKSRLAAILKTSDGFKVAEVDLQLRGPGHYFGRHQHGLNELKVANPVTQLDLLEKARHEARQMIKTDPSLGLPEHRFIKGIIMKRYPQYLDRVLAG